MNMEMNDELLNGVLEEVENMKSENTTVIDENVHSVTEALNRDEKENVEKPKGENIYVENDIGGLNRMLGLSSKDSEDDNKSAIDSENKTGTQTLMDALYSNLDENDCIEDDVIEDVTEDNDVEDENGLEGSQEQKEDSEIIKPVLLSDFMDNDTDSFTFLERNGDSYSLTTFSLDDKRQIKQAVRSPEYIFRYPKLTLRDTVLGYKEEKTESVIYYTVFFPDYEISFIVPSDYIKPYAQSFKDYFEDMVSRIRPDHLSIKHFNESITISSLKVIETGLLELNVNNKIEQYLIKNYDINFYSVLDYIRNMSDQGVEHIELKMIPAYFKKI